MYRRSKRLAPLVAIVSFFLAVSCSFSQENQITEEVTDEANLETTIEYNEEITSTTTSPDTYVNNTVGTENGNETDMNANATLIATDPNLVAFYLYPNKDNTSYLEELKYNESSTVKKSSYNPSNPTVFFIHGFLNNYTTKFSQSMKNAYLQCGLASKENIIVVDWGRLSTPDNYTYSMTEPAYPSYKEQSSDLYYRAAVNNVPRAGKRVAEFINFLTVEGFLSGPSAVHIIGFSLGAHVSGAAGYFIKQQNTSKVPVEVNRITGLDPAGPLYQNEVANEKKLEYTDAAFVDVIHTNQGQEGYYGSIGHADFHPNGGGPNQPGCQNQQGNAVPDTMSGSCAHNRVWQFYIKALSENIQACKCMGNGNVDWVLCRSMCTQKVPFGRNCPPTARGNYYLDI